MIIRSICFPCLDPFKVAIIPMVVLTIYCLFAWKLMPKEEGINQDALKKTSTEKQLTDAQEMIVYGVFVVVMLLMLLNKYTWQYALSGSGRRRSGSDLH